MLRFNGADYNFNSVIPEESKTKGVTCSVKSHTQKFQIQKIQKSVLKSAAITEKTKKTHIKIWKSLSQI